MTIRILRYNLKFLTLIKMWPREEEELNPPKKFYYQFFLICVATLINLIGSILHLTLISIANKSTYHMAEDLVIITAQCGVYYFILAYIPYLKKIAQLYKQLSEFDYFGKPPLFEDHSQLLLNLGRIYKTITNILVIAYFFEPFLTKKICKRENLKQNFKDTCGLITSAWMPFDIEAFPNKQIFYIWQAFSIFWTYEGSATISFIIVGTMEHVLVRIWHLKQLLHEAVQTRDQELSRVKLKLCLDYHNEIFRLARDVDKAFRNCLFVHVLFTGLLFGIIGYSLMTVGMSAKIISLFVVWVNSAIFQSFSAQRLHDGSISVAEEIYNSVWFQRDYKFQKDLLLIIQRAQKPIQIHGGLFAELSNVFILTIFKTAYSYLTVLKAKKTNQ